MPWPWVILGRIPRIAPARALVEFVAEAEAEAEGDDGATEPDSADGDEAADFTIPFAAPPRVTVMTAGPNPQPDPDNIDKYPYVLAVQPGYLLFNFGVAPFFGVCFDERPYQSNLIVVRLYHLAGVEKSEPVTATAERIPPRDIPARDGDFSVVSNIESIGLLNSVNGTNDFIIAELMVDQGLHSAKIVYINANDERWSQKYTANPLPDHDRNWVPSGVVTHGEKLWWFDLSWGLISYDPYDGRPVPLLHFHHLPEDRTLGMTLPDIHNHRCITESEGELRYVEIIPGGDAEEATVSMWTLIYGDNDEIIGWNLEHQVSFADIWDDDSYTRTGLPRKVPVLSVVSPSNADLVYFVLEQEERLFGVDLLMCAVFEFVDEDYDLVTPWPAPPSCRYVLPWSLTQEVAQALGLDPFDDCEGAGQLEAQIDAALLALLIEDEEELAAEIYDAVEEELQEEEIHHDEQMDMEVNAAAQDALDELEMMRKVEQEILDDDQLVEESDNEELPDLDMESDLDWGLDVKMDPETLSRLKAEVKEFARDMDHPGPSQNPGDDA